MNRLVELSLGHRLVVLLLGLLLFAGGWRAYHRLPIDAFPDVTNIQVTVISQAPTLSPLEIEQLVTYPIEQAVAGLTRNFTDRKSTRLPPKRAAVGPPPASFSQNDPACCRWGAGQKLHRSKIDTTAPDGQFLVERCRLAAGLSCA